MRDDAPDLKAATDEMFRMLDRLRVLEQAKRDAAMGSPELTALAREAEELSRLIFRWAGLQRQIADASVEAVLQGRTPPRRVGDVAVPPLHRLLAEWRQAQIRFELAQPGSPEAEAAADDIERTREAFLGLQDQKRRAEGRGSDEPTG